MRGNDENSNFHIGNEPEGSPRVSYREELEDLRLEKLGQRVTFITILIPCLIGAILFAGYMDISKRVNTAHDEGTVEIANMTRTLEARLDVLSEHYKILKESTDKNLPELGRKNADLGSDLKNLSASVKKNSTRKLDLALYKKDTVRLNKKVASLEAAVPKVKKEIKKQSRSVSKIRESQKAFSESTKDELSSLTLSLDQTISRLEKSIYNSVNLNTLQGTLDKRNASFEKQIHTLIENSGNSNLHRLEKLEKEREYLLGQLKKLQKALETKNRTMLLMDKRLKDMESKFNIRTEAQEQPGLIIEQDLSN